MIPLWWWLSLCLAQPPPPTGEVFASAARALQSGRYDAAEREFLEVLKREPGHVGALGNLGVLYSRTGQPSRAIDVYRRALKLAPGEPGLLLNLSLAYFKIEEFASAKPLLEQLEPKAGARQAQARELLAIARLQTGETEAAVTALAALAGAAQPSPAVLQFLALGHIRQGARAKADAVMERLFESLPPASARYFEGRIWYDAALFEKALESYEKAAAAEPYLPGLALETGKTLISLRRGGEAERKLRAALLENAAGDAETLYFLGALLVQNGKPAEGVPLLEQARARRPNLWGTYFYLGKAKLALNRPAEAVALLAEAARRSPSEPAVQYQLARALQASGRATEAREAFERVRKLGSKPEPLVAQ